MRIYRTTHTHDDYIRDGSTVSIEVEPPVPGARPGRVDWSPAGQTVPTYVTWYGPETEPEPDDFCRNCGHIRIRHKTGRCSLCSKGCPAFS
jgi:hypothetical protein